MWRPENWDNPHGTTKLTSQTYIATPEIESHRSFAYEAGATAMLEALRETGVPHEEKDPYMKLNHPNPGKWVFIPE